MKKQEFITSIITKAPGPIISRQEASRLSGGTYAVGSLANTDSRREGCKDRVRIGRRVGYVTASFAAWLADQIDGLED